ncbi:MAG: tetratricopeptide repeat protein [Pseudohongiella sp.]|nr:tetratricopeptide repeat protein [Pseudohongiella sp.]
MTNKGIDDQPPVKQHSVLLRVLLLCGWGLHLPVIAQNSALEQAITDARQLLDQQRAAEAFALLIQLELDGSGDLGFDYWLGVVAVRAGELDQAITALERAIMVQPAHAGARLELAGTFILQNRTTEASTQLDIVEQMNPPESARLAIERYRQTIAQLEQSTDQYNKLSMIGVDLGYDSNYLSYPDSFDLFANTPLQGIALLASDSTQFSQLRGLHFREFAGWGPFERNEWLTSIQTRQNENHNARAFDTTSAQTTLTAVGTFFNDLELRVAAGINQLWLDGDNYRTGLSSSVQLRQVFDNQSEWSGTLRMGKNRFTDSRNDNNALSGELVYQKNITADNRLRVAAFVESEDTSGQLTRQGGDGIRQRLDAQITFGQPQARNRFVLGVNYQHLKYESPGFAVLNRGVAEKRRDYSTTGHVEWVFQATERWRFSSRIQHREQSSSLAFFDMDQALAQISINYMF